MEIKYNNETFRLFFHEDENRWVLSGRIPFNDLKLFLEIPLKYFYQELDWGLLPGFLSYVNENIINTNLNYNLKQLLFDVAEKSNWFLGDKETFKYRFELSGIDYREPRMSLTKFRDIQYNYSLMYRLYHASYNEDYDPDTQYLIDLAGIQIIGFRKESFEQHL